MEKAIEQTKNLISSFLVHGIKNKNLNQEYNRFYGFTNERIAEYLKAANIKPKTVALSVLASGDHAFNLVANGIKDVDTFDINRLTEYYVFGIKYALIIKYNYSDFLEIYKKIYSRQTNWEEIVSIIKELLPFMDQKYRLYWQDILKFYIKTLSFGKPYNLFEPLIINWDKVNKLSPHIERFNAYLSNEANYEQFKSNLMASNISFTHSNLIDLPKNFNKKYDYLLFSNILDYIYKSWGTGWGTKDLQTFLASLSPILKNNASIFLHYSFHPTFVMIAGSSINKFNPSEVIDLKQEENIFRSAQIIKKYYRKGSI